MAVKLHSRLDLLSKFVSLSTTAFSSEHFPDSSPELKHYFERRHLIAGPQPKNTCFLHNRTESDCKMNALNTSTARLQTTMFKL